MHSLILLGLITPSILATTVPSFQYNAIKGFTNANGCVPSGYFQAQDLGRTKQADMISRCEAQCTSYSRCEAWVGQLNKAADSNLYSGSCFYYSSPPNGPRQCADRPTALLAEQKDRTYPCLTCSAKAATAFCSSYLGISPVTVYTGTFTPRAIATATALTTTDTTTRTTVLSTTTTLATLLTTTTSTDISATTVDVLSAVFSTDTVTTTVTRGTVTQQAPFVKRTAAAVPAPGCLQTGLPASRISSACSRLSIKPKTVSLLRTAATSTNTQTNTQTLTNRFTSTGTSVVISTTTTTDLVVSIVQTTVTSLNPTTRTSIATVVSQVTVPSPAFTFRARYTNGCYPLTLQGQFYNIPASNFGQALQYCADKCTNLDNSGFYPQTQECRQIYVSYNNADRTGGYDCQWGGTVNGPGNGEWSEGNFQCGLGAPYRKYGEWYQVVGKA
ncbi:hypothetical protein VTL71DRAFT_8865 [Oculimacula yallundae]|uniref:Apple domain-containing protein n=1 Tax=Oculimacula yallundae TaxID=86028 RepID=A0ABR4BT79_9HELO